MPESFEHARREHRSEAERHVRAVPDFLDRGADDVGEALPAIARIAGQTVPAGVDEFAIRLRVTVWRRHFAVREPRALTVAHRIERIEHFLSEFRGLGQYRVDEVRRDLFVARQRDHFVEPGELAKRELDVFERGGIGRHLREP